ncbi:Abi family protein [Lacticaseibacillus hulanensis]|uniref:Abi family protein n=1 Tax=Lacticaseibacillus hulanensis TaxID=2493111 RepID=UPI000FD6BED0|nr:Abi family protein [Lacticaseibacillus hulanensis]
MSKKREFKTIDEQLQLLQERGLTINDEVRSRRYLLTNNYYNIVNGYSKYFQEETDRFIEGADFDEISHLYFYDKEIKEILLNGILSAEHHLKSALAYRFAEAYPNKRYAYLNVGCYRDDVILEVIYTISKISKLIKQNKKYKGNSINYYVTHYDDVPIWVLVDYLDFGDVQSLISCLPVKIQNKIAKDMTGFLEENLQMPNLVLPPETLVSFIKNVHETRNVCAHGNRLLGFTTRASGKYYEPLHSKYNIREQDERKSVYPTILSLKCFLSRTEYCVLYNSLRKRTKILGNKLHSIEINDISKLLGFPDGWQAKPPLNQ